jgi:hypothetical protein
MLNAGGACPNLIRASPAIKRNNPNSISITFLTNLARGFMSSSTFSNNVCAFSWPASICRSCWAYGRLLRFCRTGHSTASTSRFRRVNVICENAPVIVGVSLGLDDRLVFQASSFAFAGISVSQGNASMDIAPCSVIAF